MRQKTFNFVVGIVFLAIFLLHGARLIYGWEAVIGGVILSVWVSWLALVVSGLLAYAAFSKKK